MTHNFHGTTRTDAVDAASWVAHLPLPSQDGATQLVVGATVVAMEAPHAPTPPIRATVSEASRGVGRTDVRAMVGRVTPQGRS